MIIAIDNSASMEGDGKFKNVVSATIKFVDNSVSRDELPFRLDVFHFNSRVTEQLTFNNECTFMKYLKGEKIEQTAYEIDLSALTTRVKDLLVAYSEKTDVKDVNLVLFTS